jgi:hypothetical protein
MAKHRGGFKVKGVSHETKMTKHKTTKRKSSRRKHSGKK